MKDFVIVGAGGHSRETRWLVNDINKEISDPYNFIGYVVSDLDSLGKNDSKNEVIGDFSFFDENKNDISVVIGIGNPVVRIKLSELLVSEYSNLNFPNLIHPSVEYDHSSSKFGKGIMICANTVLTVNVILGDFVVINYLCAIGHEAVIGRGSVINPSTAISGGVNIGEGTLIGSGSKIIQYTNIGDYSVLGSGSVATNDIPSNSLAVGIPAKVKKVING